MFAIKCAARHTSFAKRTSLGVAVIICRRQTSLKKALACASAFFWLGWPDLNRRVRESKSRALPLGDIPLWRTVAESPQQSYYITQSILCQYFFRHIMHICCLFFRQSSESPRLSLPSYPNTYHKAYRKAHCSHQV